MAKVVSTIPQGFATGVVRNVFLTATFDTDLSRDSINEYTVLLLRASDRKVVAGLADYIPGTRTVTFQLSELLDKNTDYVWILVSRTEGILTVAGTAALSVNEQISFTTGEEIDYSIPLTGDSAITGSVPYFKGGGGVYEVVFGRTGEPISLVVTTMGQVGPSGNIVSAPAGTAAYLAASGIDDDPGDIEVSGTLPADSDTWLPSTNFTEITATFDDNVVITGLANDGVTVVVEDLLGLDVAQPTITTTVAGNVMTMTPDAILVGTKWTVTLSKDIAGETKDPLGTDYVFSFILRPDLFYTTVEMVRINLQEAASKISDDEIRKLIYENSRWAFIHAKVPWTITAPPTFVQDYVLCKTKKDVIDAVLMGNNAATSKRIGDVEFRYGTDLKGRFASKLQDLNACIDAAQQQIVSGTGGTLMKTAVKALNAPDRPGKPQTWRRLGTTGGFENNDSPGL